MNISTAREGFLYYLGSEGYSQATIILYGGCINRLVEYLGDTEIENVTESNLRAFMNHLRTGYQPKRLHQSNKPLTPATIDNYWTALRTFFKWTHKEFKSGRPEETISRPQYKDTEVMPYTKDEVIAMLKAATSVTHKSTKKRKGFVRDTANARRNRAMITLLLDTGIRLGELCRLELKDIDMNARTLTVVAFGSGRKSRPRTIPLGNVAHQALWKYFTGLSYKLRPDETVFDMTSSGIQSMLFRLKKRTGIPNVHAHRFRHTFAVQYLRNGGDIFTLKYFLGHSSLTMVQRYLHFATSDRQAMHSKASPGDRWLQRRR